MSRSGYTEYEPSCQEENWDQIRWRGAVLSATRGSRGQRFFKELLAALDAMPDKKLIANELEASGQFCTIGVLGDKRGVDMSEIDPEDAESVGAIFDIAESLAREVVYMNDEGSYNSECPRQRFIRMRAWVESQIAKPKVIKG